MKTKNCIILALMLCVFLTLSENSYGQNTYGRVTPQTADFMKYGDIPVSLFAGRMNIEIPLYRIKDQDFDIPIGLLYTADGFKPEKRSDFVGLDWTLIAGGCITREIYGAPDDFRATSMVGQEDGFMRVVKNTTFQDKDKIWNMDPSLIIPANAPNGYYVKPSSAGFFQDYQPDLFMFNFNGQSGQFMINNKGVGQANRPEYKVDISGLAEQPARDMSEPNVSTLRITTPDGYLYEFGGKLDALEYSISYTDGNEFKIGEMNPTILAWYLTKITAPNGRTVTFNYLPVEYFKTSPIWQAGRGAYTSAGINPPIMASATKKAVLSSITVDSVKVEFNKSIEKTLGDNGRFFLTQITYNFATYQLDSVVVKYNNVRQFSDTLTYENNYKRRFLATVTVADGGTYKFGYSHANYPTLDAIPFDQTQGDKRDDYGYWTDNNSTSSYGLMSKITYPTGGYSTFTYERHQYTQALELQLSDLKKKLVSSSNQSILYGARIKTITNYTSASVKEMDKEYIYANTINNGTGSGILYQSRPCYMDNLNRKNDVGGYTWNKNYNIDESPIGYSSVIEKRNDGSYILYRFTNYANNPDQGEMVNIKPNNNIVTDIGTYIYLAFNSINRVNSNSGTKGLLAEKLIYDSSGTLKSQEQSLYKNVSTNFPITVSESDLICDCNSSLIQSTDNSYIVSFKGFTGGGISRKIYLKTNPQVLQRVKTDNVVSEEWYRYNPYNQLRSKSIVINQTDTLRTNYFYPTERSEWYSTELVAKNRLSPIIEQITYRASSTSAAKELKRIRTDYKYAVSGNTLLVPNTVQSSYSGSGQWQTDFTYNSYNGKGSVLQQTAIDQVPIVYLWSYNYQYPIAEIKGATYAEVKTALGNYTDTQVETLAAKIDPAADMATINSLRTKLPQALVTTYTYKPLFGIATMTDPRGVVTKYDYDAFGRLIKVTQADKVIEEYKYNYKN